MTIVKIMVTASAIMAWASVACMAQDQAKEGGVTCELIVSNTTWKIPDQALGKRVPVALALRVTNHTTNALVFCQYDTLRPILRAKSGKDFQMDGGRNRSRLVRPEDYRILQPGEGTTFAVDAHIYWQNNSLVLGGEDGFGGLWFFTGLDAGEYDLAIAYAYDDNSRNVAIARGKGVLNFGEDEVWKGELISSFIRISLER